MAGPVSRIPFRSARGRAGINRLTTVHLAMARPRARV